MDNRTLHFDHASLSLSPDFLSIFQRGLADLLQDSPIDIDEKRKRDASRIGDRGRALLFEAQL